MIVLYYDTVHIMQKYSIYDKMAPLSGFRSCFGRSGKVVPVWDLILIRGTG